MIKKISCDFIYSLIASALPIIIIQLILYPTLSRFVDSSAYGLILTLMGVVNTIYISLGTPLNNTRLIQNEKYDEIKGDFNFLLIMANIIGAVLIITISIYIFQLTFLMIMGLILLTIISITNSYLMVSYRLILDFKLYICISLMECIGYLIGISFLKIYSELWIFAFIFAQFFSLLYLIFTCSLYKEPLTFTKYFKQTTIKYIWLVLSNIVSNALNYLDRLILFPLLGGTAVATFSTATFFGKSLSMILVPISGVLLSYLSQRDYKMTIKKYLYLNGLVFILTISFVIFSYYASPWVTGLLYPTLINDSIQYIVIGNLGAIVGSATALCSPFIIKYAPSYWNFVVNGLYGISYIVLGTTLLNYSGIYGFCIALLLANILRMTVTFIVGGIYIKKNRRIVED